MDNHKKAIAALSVPTLIFTFTYLNFFGIPFLPSIWQMANFIVTLFLDYAAMFFILAALIYLGLHNRIKERIFSRPSLLFICFILGLFISNNQLVSNLLFSTKKILLPILMLGTGLAISSLIWSAVDTSAVTVKKSAMVILCVISFFFMSKMYIVYFVDFPRVSNCCGLLI